MAADKFDNFTAGPSYAQILNTGNNAANEKGDDQVVTAAPFIAPESCKPSIKVPVKNAFSLLKKDLGAEVQTVGEPALGEKRIWADEVGEALEFENQVTRRSNNEETILHVEHQHHNPALHDLERELVNEKDNAQPQTLMDHGNVHSNVISVDNLEDNWDHPTQPVTQRTSFEEPNSDSLNTSDLSPSKVFARDE
ncbi:hypothetical protein TorRG33x02_353340, partial [Trema orientale]